MDNLFDFFYGEIVTTFQEINNIIIKERRYHHTKEYDDNFINNIQLLEKESKYIDDRIYDEIVNHDKYNNIYNIVFPLNLNQNSNEIYCDIKFYGYDSNILNKNNTLSSMILFIQMLYHLSIKEKIKHQFKDIKIHIFFTDFEKKLPKNKEDELDAYHINTGLTLHKSYNGEILIYRKEEWYKVLIHEMIHLLGFDNALFYDKHEKQIIHLFQFKKINRINYNEAYVECIAEIIHILLLSIIQVKNMNDYKKIYTIFMKKIHGEIEYSKSNILKIMNHMNIDITNNQHLHTSFSNYHENTNIMSYYFIKSYLYHDIEKFVNWLTFNGNIIINTQLNYNLKNKPFGSFLVDMISKSSLPTSLLEIRNRNRNRNRKLIMSKYNYFYK